MRWLILSLLLLLFSVHTLRAESKTLDPKTNPELAKIIQDLRSKGSGATEAQVDEARQVFARASAEILIYAQASNMSAAFLSILEDLILTAPLQDRYFGEVLIAALERDQDQWTLLKALGKHLDNDRALQAILRSRSIIVGLKSPDVPATLLAWAKESIERLPTAKAAEGESEPFCYHLRDLCLECLKNQYPTDEGFIEMLWGYLDRPNHTASNLSSYREIMSAYHGPKLGKLLSQGLSARSSDIRAFARELTLQGKVSEAYPALIQSCQAELLAEKPADPEVVAKQLGVLAESDPKAFSVLLSVYLKRYQYNAGQEIKRLLVAKPDHFTHALWLEALAAFERGLEYSTVYGDLAAADLGPAVKEAAAWYKGLNRPEDYRRIYFNQVLFTQKDPTLVEFIRELKDAQPVSKLEMLNMLLRRPVSATVGLGLLPWLEDKDVPVQQATFKVLQRSDDPKITSRLGAFNAQPDDKLIYLTLSQKVKLPSWSITPQKGKITGAFASALKFTNNGYIALEFPLAFGMHYGVWYLAEGDKWIGPIPIKWPVTPELLKAHDQATFSELISPPVQVMETEASEAPSRLKPIRSAAVTPVVFQANEEPQPIGIPPHTTLELWPQVGEALAALGPGTHKVRLIYFSRSSQRHWPGNPDFSLTSPEVTVTVENTPDWSLGQQIQVGVNSPDPKRRDWAWAQFENLPSSHVVPSEIDDAVRQLRESEKEKTFSLVLRSTDQEIRHTTYHFTGQDGKYKFRWEWDEEDIRGGGEIEISASEKRAFFNEFYQYLPFGGSRAQTLGGPYESKVDLTFGFGKVEPKAGFPEPFTLDGVATQKTFTSKDIWLYEIGHHPDMKKWYDRMMKWKERSEKQPK